MQSGGRTDRQADMTKLIFNFANAHATKKTVQ